MSKCRATIVAENYYHDDVIKWKLVFVLLVLCAGNSPVTVEFPTQRPVTRSFDNFFDLCLNQRLSKQWKRRWFETPSRSLWRHLASKYHLGHRWFISSLTLCDYIRWKKCKKRWKFWFILCYLVLPLTLLQTIQWNKITDTPLSLCTRLLGPNGPLTRYVKLQAAHAREWRFHHPATSKETVS